MNLFVIIGSSGSGKTSLTNFIAKKGHWEECISHTTRPMREGEVDGETYYFINRDEFQRMFDNDEFAENVEYSGNYYGLSKSEIDRIKDSHSNNVFVIAEHNGYKQLKKIYPDAVSIFIYSTKGDCIVNMLERGDSVRDVYNRILNYFNELKHKDSYDYVVKNTRGKFLETAEEIISIIKKHNNC